MSTNWEFPQAGTLQSKLNVDAEGYLLDFESTSPVGGTKNFNLTSFVTVPEKNQETTNWGMMYLNVLELFGIVAPDTGEGEFTVDFSIKIDDQVISTEGGN